MRIENKSTAYGWAAGLWALIVGLALVNGSCAHVPAPVEVEKVQPTRTPAQRADAAVEIVTSCGMGSGVLIDARRVLTANHVVNCATWPMEEAPKIILVRTLAGTTHIASIDIADGGRDLARLTLDRDVPGVPVSIRKAVEKDIVCAAVAIPERGFKCGGVDGFSDVRHFGDVEIDGAVYWFGNSGSGVYAEDGMLVGIVTRLKWCSQADAWLWGFFEIKPERTCGGRISSIVDSPVMP